MKQSIVDRVADFLTRRELLPAPHPIALAFSGGSDSTALFYTLIAIREKIPFDFVALHVDYHLRGDESILDEQFVRELCERHGVPCYVRDVDPNAFRDVNIELRAREIRYRFFDEMTAALPLSAILLAHHRRDQAETALYRILKGNSGVVGMREQRGNYYRPFLRVSKSDVDRYLADVGIRYRYDASNTSRDFQRNRLRNDVLPVLREIDADVESRLADYAEKVTRRDDALLALINALAASVIRAESESKIEYDLAPLKTQSDAVLEEFIRIAIFARYGIDAATTRILELRKQLRSTRPTISIAYENTIIVRKTYDVLTIETSRSSSAPFSRSIESEGVYSLTTPIVGSNDAAAFPSHQPALSIEKERSSIAPFSRTIEGEGVHPLAAATVIRVVVEPCGDVTLPSRDLVLDYEKVRFPITIRSRLDGDVVKAYPDRTRRRLKRILIDRKIPRDERDGVPVFVDGGGSVVAFALGFVEGGGRHIIGSDYAIDANTTRVVGVSLFSYPNPL